MMVQKMEKKDLFSSDHLVNLIFLAIALINYIDSTLSQLIKPSNSCKLFTKNIKMYYVNVFRVDEAKN
ncbi:hypothetical protein HZS_4136 [Henneguya salminicola]|nr:hypothetical protein HZS_4136 [Henneguya salminicola]